MLACVSAICIFFPFGNAPGYRGSWPEGPLKQLSFQLDGKNREVAGVQLFLSSLLAVNEGKTADQNSSVICVCHWKRISTWIKISQMHLTVFYSYRLQFQNYFRNFAAESEKAVLLPINCYFFVVLLWKKHCRSDRLLKNKHSKISILSEFQKRILFYFEKLFQIFMERVIDKWPEL